jgi:hypothetical protein
MELDLKIGMPVRYENQRKGIVKDIRAATNEAVVVFEGDGMDELIYVGYLRPF